MLLEKSSSRFNYIIEKFKSVKEVIDVIEQRKPNFSSDNKYDRSFSKLSSYQELKELVLYGWEQEVKNFERKIKDVDKSKMQSSAKTKFFEDVNGFAPIIPNALKGLPHSMINSKRILRKNKVINVVLDATYPGRISTEQIISYYSDVFAYLVGLEKSGYRVNIDVSMTFSEEDIDTVHHFELNLKKEYQPIDIKRLMFPIVHTGMLRALGFEWYERLPDAQHINGYGKAFHYWPNESAMEEVKTALDLNDKKRFYIYYSSDYKAILKGVS